MKRKHTVVSHHKQEYRLQVNIATTLHGVHWIMHNHDDDINDPSVPHCHAVEKNWKLDIYSGTIYDYSNGKREIGKLSHKEFKSLWKQAGFVQLVLQERVLYEELRKSNPQKYPPLPAMSGSVKRGKYKLVISHRWINKMLNNHSHSISTRGL